MVITDNKLIQGLVENVEQLAALHKDSLTQAILHSSRSMLYELDRRANFEKTDSYYREGRSLLATASAIAELAADKAEVIKKALNDLPDRLPANFNAQCCAEKTERLREGMLLLIEGSGFPFVASEPAKAAITELLAWELKNYRQTAPAIAEVKAHERPVVVDGPLLENYMRSHCAGFEDASVTQCNPLPGGFSKNTVLFDVQTVSGIEKLAYRGTQKNQILEKVMVDVANEFQVVSYAFSQGAAVAEPMWLQSDAGATGTRFFISRRMPGTNLGTAIQAHKEVSAVATRSLAEALAKIHGLPLDPSNGFLKKSHIKPPTADSSLPDIVRNRVMAWHAHWKSLDCGIYPVLDLSFQWLLDNVSPAEDDAVLVHGDYGLHNILIHEDEVTAVLDWEACHVGDRALDLSHILAGTTGKMDHELFMQTYISAGGKPVSEFRLRYYQVMMAMQFMLCTVEAQMIYQRRPGAGTNYCTLGLGFIHHTAQTINEGILKASAAKTGLKG